MNTAKALDILGLTPNPSRLQLKRAYREQVKLWHPDRYSNGSALKIIAQKNVQDANLAYAFLKRKRPRSAAKPAAPAAKVPSGGRAPIVPEMRRQGFQWLTAIRRLFSRIDFHLLGKWLPRDARRPYRPWYRYPGRNDRVRENRPNMGFEPLLRKALRDPAKISRIKCSGRSSLRDDEKKAVTPIKKVSPSCPPPGLSHEGR
jgi:curved DNA-binding protein CbpA